MDHQKERFSEIDGGGLGLGKSVMSRISIAAFFLPVVLGFSQEKLKMRMC